MGYKKIANLIQLKALAELDSKNVGVTETGVLYVYDFEKVAAVIITVEKASEILGLPLEIIGRIVESRGDYQISIEVPKKVLEEEKEPDEFECEKCGMPFCMCDEEEELPESCQCGCEELRKELNELKSDLESGRELHSNLYEDVQKIKQDFYLK